MKEVNSCDAHLDAKNKITLRGKGCQNYKVTEFKNACIWSETDRFEIPDSISIETLEKMDEAIANLKADEISLPIDLTDFV